jgi:hypothetical protein
METPKFFIPNSDDYEQDYIELASFCKSAPQPPSRRIYSITYISNRQDWTATVGERLKGVEIKTKRRGTYHREDKTRLSDPATVLAIFPGIAYMVITDAQPIGNTRSAWVNPFMAGQPTNVIYFAE